MHSDLRFNPSSGLCINLVILYYIILYYIILYNIILYYASPLSASWGVISTSYMHTYTHTTVRNDVSAIVNRTGIDVPHFLTTLECSALLLLGFSSSQVLLGLFV